MLKLGSLASLSLQIAVLAFASSSAFAAKIDVFCDNAPATGWRTYYCMFGTYDTVKREFTNVEFGTCEGSGEAGESEPVEQVEIALARINPAMNATSPQWRNAYAFDFTNEVFGATTFYVQPAELGRIATASAVARIKLERPTPGTYGGDKLYCR